MQQIFAPTMTFETKVSITRNSCRDECCLHVKSELSVLPYRTKLALYLIQTNNKLLIIDAQIMQPRQILDMTTPQPPELAYRELHQD